LKEQAAASAGGEANPEALAKMEEKYQS